MIKIKNILSALIVLAMVILSQQIIIHALRNQTNKIEYAELNHIRYGLLSIDEWKNQISAIVSTEIDKLEFAQNYEKDLKLTVENQLIVLIDKVSARIEKTNEKTLKGRVKQTFLEAFVDIDDIKKGIPEYANAMIREMKKPKSQNKIKELLKIKINEYIKETFDDQDMSQVNRIVHKKKAISIEDAKIKLVDEITNRYEQIANSSAAIIILAACLFLISALNLKPLSSFTYFTLVSALLILLFTGVTTPMIDMEAKISEMIFILLDNPIKFENQVLYFQSKSVLDVFWIMITHETVQMKAVGILMVLFSVVFPICKLLSSMAYFFNYKNAKENGLVKWFVEKSGKWSMADVLVVAIFMAYIGFNGIISSQFGKLSTTSEELVVLTTNGTSLQPGFYIFFTYVMLSLFLSVYLAREIPQSEHDYSR